MPTLTETIREKQKADTAAAKDRYKDLMEQAQAGDDYRRLLGRGDNPEAGDDAKLLEMLGKCGLTLEGAEADLKALLRVRELESQRVPQSAVDEAYAAQVKALDDVKAAEAALLAARNAVGPSGHAVDRVRRQQMSVESAIDSLKRQHPRVFAAEWPAPASK